MLVKPVTAPSVDSSQVYLSDNQVSSHGSKLRVATLTPFQPYYNYFTHHIYPASTSVRHVTVPSPLESFPLLVQGGNILPIRARARRASTLMWRDPFTLVIALGRQGDAQGELYLDDGESFGYEKGDFVWREFRAVSEKGSTVVSSINKITNENGSALTHLGGWASQIADVRVEKLVILGLEKEPTKVTVDGEAGDLGWVWEGGCAAGGKAEGTASRLTIKAPGVRVVREWSIRIV